jgi:hypothetical protein
MEYGKLAKAQATRVYKVPALPATLQAVKLFINTSAKWAKIMLHTFHHQKTRNMC